MKIMRKSDDSLLDIDDITAQISTARPVGCKSKKVLQGECCCQEQFNLAMHFSAQVKLTTYEKQTMEVRELEQAEPDEKEKMDCGAGFFQRVDLDVEAALGGPNQA